MEKPCIIIDKLNIYTFFLWAFRSKITRILNYQDARFLTGVIRLFNRESLLPESSTDPESTFTYRERLSCKENLSRLVKGNGIVDTVIRFHLHRGFDGISSQIVLKRFLRINYPPTEIYCSSSLDKPEITTLCQTKSALKSYPFIFGSPRKLFLLRNYFKNLISLALAYPVFKSNKCINLDLLVITKQKLQSIYYRGVLEAVPSFAHIDATLGSVTCNRRSIANLYSPTVTQFWRYLHFQKCVLRRLQGVGIKGYSLLGVQILTDTKFLFWFREFLAINKIRLVYTCLEGSSKVLVANMVCKRSANSIALTSTVSFGYYPEFGANTYKNADIFAAWGSAQINNAKLSGDKSTVHIITGYQGDTPLHRSNARDPTDDLKILLIDNVFSQSGLIRTSVFMHVIDCLVDIMAHDRRLKLLVKTKHALWDDYSHHFREYSLEGRVTVLLGQGNTSQFSASDLVISVGASSLGLYCASQGIPTVLYDPDQTLDSRLKTPSLRVCRRKRDLKRDLVEMIVRKYSPERFVSNPIHPFNDSCSQARLADVMKICLRCDNKRTALQEVVHKYKERKVDGENLSN